MAVGPHKGHNPQNFSRSDSEGSHLAKESEIPKFQVQGLYPSTNPFFVNILEQPHYISAKYTCTYMGPVVQSAARR